MSKFNMQNIVVWIKNDEKGGFKFKYPDKADNYLKLQVENSLNLGWPKEDIIVITNFPFEHMGVKAHIATDICRWSAFVNKLVVIDEMIKKGVVNDNFWLHDADAYQLVPFSFPENCKDVGFTQHAPGRQKPQGGSSFYRKSAYDIVEAIATMIKIVKPRQEEIFFPPFYQKKNGARSIEKLKGKIKIFEEKVKLELASNEKYKNKKDFKPKKKYRKKLRRVTAYYEEAKKYYGAFADRMSWLDWTYCLFRQSHFSRKYPRAEKPIKVVHFHTEYPSTMNCFYYGKNKFKVRIVTDELEKLFLKYGLITEEQRR